MAKSRIVKDQMGVDWKNLDSKFQKQTVDNLQLNKLNRQIDRENNGMQKETVSIYKNAGINGTRKGGQVSDIIDFFQKENQLLIPEDGDRNIIGTAMPYQYNLFSDIITNPSSVSTSEFQKMAYSDPVIYSALIYMATVVSDMISKYRHEDEEIEEFINYSLDTMVISKVKMIRFIMTAMWAGFSVCEKVYKVKPCGEENRSRITIDNIIPLPPNSLIFRVDSSGVLKEDGIVQYYYNNLWTGYANIMSFNQYTPNNGNTPNPYAKRGDLDTPLRTVWAQPIGTVILPRRKVIHYTVHGLDGLLNPYGRSMLRSAYQYYVQKQAMLQITLVAANYKSSPIPIFFCDPTVNVIDANGNPVSLAQDVTQAISSLRGNGFLVLNAQKDTMVAHDTIDNTADIEKYIEILNYYDQQLLHSLLTPASLFSIEQGGSYSLGLTHSSAHGRVIKLFAEDIASCLLRDYVRDLLDLNFGEDVHIGRFELVESSLDDKLKYGKLLDFSIKSNLLNMDDLKDVNTARFLVGFDPVKELYMSPLTSLAGTASEPDDPDAMEKHHGGSSTKKIDEKTKKPYRKTSKVQ